MSTIGITHGQASSIAESAGSMRVHRALLWCGVVSSALYVATDIIGGLRYPGYSFTSQAISELMARGAPSEPVVDTLFLVYSVLAVAFGIGVFREGQSNRQLRLTGALLALYAALGATGPTLFEMDQRGAGSLTGDTPHIILTAVISLLLLLAMGLGAMALGRRFRAFSFASMLVVAAFGGFTGTFASQLAAGQPTPGMGIVERVCIYTSMLWIAVLGATLLRRRGSSLS